MPYPYPMTISRFLLFMSMRISYFFTNMQRPIFFFIGIAVAAPGSLIPRQDPEVCSMGLSPFCCNKDGLGPEMIDEGCVEGMHMLLNLTISQMVQVADAVRSLKRVYYGRRLQGRMFGRGEGGKLLYDCGMVEPSRSISFH